MRKKLLVVLFAMMLILGFTTSAYAAYSGLYGEPATNFGGALQADVPMATGDGSDNSIGNANDTGYDTVYGTDRNDVAGADALNVIKSDNMNLINGDPETQRTHGSYQNNTNSCASCHQTHTGASENLLFKQGIYNTCTACHDGTLGFYNVFADRNMANPTIVPSAGSFGALDADDSGNPSVHLSTGIGVTISAAPGGNLSNETTPTANGGVAGPNGTWTAAFDCAECHAPHGSYSDRLLHYSPNGMGSVPIANGGLQVSESAVVPFANLGSVAADDMFVLVSGTAGQLNITTEAAGTNVVALFKRSMAGGPLVRDNTAFGAATPWLTDTELKITTGATVDPVWGKGYVKETVAGSIYAADVNRAYVVKLFSTDYPAIPLTTFGGAGGVPIVAVNPSIYDENGYGQAITAYCAACHTDYQAGGVGPEGTGMYTVAYRHNTINNIVNCLKCHYAHGTNVNVMRDAQNRLATDTSVEYMLDKNPSSALKRYTNMAVCWKCHATGALTTKLINNDGFWTDKLLSKTPTGTANGNW